LWLALTDELIYSATLVMAAIKGFAVQTLKDKVLNELASLRIFFCQRITKKLNLK